MVTVVEVVLMVVTVIIRTFQLHGSSGCGSRARASCVNGGGGGSVVPGKGGGVMVMNVVIFTF